MKRKRGKKEKEEVKEIEESKAEEVVNDEGKHALFVLSFSPSLLSSSLALCLSFIPSRTTRLARGGRLVPAQFAIPSAALFFFAHKKKEEGGGEKIQPRPLNF